MTGESAFPPVIGGNLKTSGPPKRIVGEREVAMKYAGLLILLASTLMPSQDAAKFYLIAVDGFTLENAQQNPTPPTNSAAAPPSGSGTVAVPNQAPSPQDGQ